MSRTVAESSAAYRRRRADKMVRYEAALRKIAAAPGNVSMPSDDLFDASRIAHNALVGDSDDGSARDD